MMVLFNRSDHSEDEVEELEAVINVLDPDPEPRARQHFWL